MGKEKTKNCEYCHCEFHVDTRKGPSRKYCSKKCKLAKFNETYLSHKLICEFCGNDYLVPECRAKSAKFCSRVCQNSFYVQAAHKERITLVCLVCKEPFEVITGSKRKYCSPVCSQTGNRTAPRVVIQCKVCGKDIEKYESSPVRFCGRNCQYAAQSNGMIKLYSRGRDGVRTDLGIYFRSAFEADYARWCKHIGLDFVYEAKTFEVHIDDTKTMSYTPDFFHPDTNEFVELKAGRKDHAYEKNLLALESLKSDGLNIRVVYMKDFYDSLKTKGLFDVIENLEFRDYKRTKHLVEHRV